MTEAVKMKLKFECVLLELLKSDYKLTDDTVLEKLVTHLSSEEEGFQVIDVTTCLKWVQSAFNLWHQGNIKAPIASFALRLLGIILQNENNFICIKDQSAFIDKETSPVNNSWDILDQFKKFLLSDTGYSSNFSIKFSIVKVLLSLLSHHSGRQWIMNSGVWTNILSFSLTDTSMYVVRESRLFLSRLLNEIPSENSAQAEFILAQVLDSFITVPLTEGSSSELVKLTSNLFLVSDILDRAFHTIDLDSNVLSSIVVEIIRKPKFNVLQKTLEMLKFTDDEILEEQLSKIAVLLYILHIIKESKSMEPKDMKGVCLEILNVFNILITKGSVQNVLKLCVMCHNHWNYVRNLDVKEKNEEDVEITKYHFEDQLLCLQLVPIFCCIISSPEEKEKEVFVNKLFHSTCHESLRLLFHFRDTVIQLREVHHYCTLCVTYAMCLNSSLAMLIPISIGCIRDQSTLEEIFVHQIVALIDPENVRTLYLFRDSIVQKGLVDRSGQQAIASLSAVKNQISRERAVMVFQSFVYILKHFVVSDVSNVKQGGWGGEFRQSHHSALLVAILEGLAYIIHTYRITWRESVESMCILSLALQLLDSPTHSLKVGLVVRGLKLVRLCIENFMPPNLALLTNSINGTSVDQLGPLIFKRLHDPSWEVRDSSLELLHVIASISHHKYPLFQDLILENKLCEVVVHLALNDAESYVCASATKCLTAMVCVDRLWNDDLQGKDLVNKMIGILTGESEAVLRREAALLMSQIFKHQKVSEEVFHKICGAMSHVVISDLHWEVKVNALDFWELVIEHSMDNQGMIDGEFPEVTFSKEHKKIVNLTPDVIRDHLRKVLDELSRRGCLHVLIAAIHFEEDLEVVKKASQIITSLSNVLERHGLVNIKSPVSSSSEPTDVQNLFKIGSFPESCASQQLESSLLIVDGSDKLESQNLLGDKSCLKNNVTPLIKETESPCSLGEVDSIETNFVQSTEKCNPQTMSFDALDEFKSDTPSLTSQSLQESVINAILNDRDINLLASVYMSSEAELPGRQGPETKISKPIRPLVVMNPNAFLNQLEVLQVQQIVKDRVRWVEETGNHLGPLLDDMLIMRHVQCDEDSEECNAMDCY